MKDIEKLKYVLEYYEASELILELFEKVKNVPQAQDWLDSVYRGSPEEYEDFDYLDEYARNPNWRSL